MDPDGSEKFDQRLYSLLVQMAEVGMPNAARGLAGIVGQDVTVHSPGIRLVPLTDIPTLLGGPENEAVGIYLRADGEIAGQMMIVVPYLKALELVNLMMEAPPGSTRQLGALERSALAELGNMTGTFFLNAIADATGLEARPSPPAVMVDMVGAILDILLATSAGLSEYVLMIQTTFSRGGREEEASFWMIPDRHTLDAIVGNRKAAHV